MRIACLWVVGIVCCKAWKNNKKRIKVLFFVSMQQSKSAAFLTEGVLGENDPVLFSHLRGCIVLHRGHGIILNLEASF